MEIKELIRDLETLEKRNDNFLHLTAYENRLSPLANHFLSSRLSERYYFGAGTNEIVDWNPFTALGLGAVQNILDSASEALERMLKAKAVNFNCLSGVHTMMSAILSTSDPGDTVMIVHHNDGGHFATKLILERTGRKFVYAPFKTETQGFDLDKMAKEFSQNNCKVLYLDISYYVTPIDIAGIRKALGDKAIIIYDASHTVGLMIGHQFQSPLEEGADIICANTHKTLPGPQKGIIVFRDQELADKANSVINSGLFSSAHTHHLIALAITILEMEKYGEEFSAQIIENSNELGKTLEDLGHEVRHAPDGSISHTHQVHLYIDKLGDRKQLYERLVKNNISTNFEDRIGGRLFIRLGTQEITRRGMKKKEMIEIASLLTRTLRNDSTLEEVKAFNEKFSKIYYGFEKDML